MRQLARQLREAETLDTSTYPRARALFEEAKQVGLIDERLAPLDYETVFAALQSATNDDRVRDDLVVGDGEDALAALRAERQGFRRELERVNSEIRSTRLFSSETSGYEREAREQRARLSAVGLIKETGHNSAYCPLCESHLETPSPTVSQISKSLPDLSEHLEVVEAENPRLPSPLVPPKRGNRA